MVPAFEVWTLYTPFPVGMTLSLSFRARASGKLKDECQIRARRYGNYHQEVNWRIPAKGPLNAIQRQKSRSLLEGPAPTTLVLGTSLLRPA